MHRIIQLAIALAMPALCGVAAAAVMPKSELICWAYGDSPISWWRLWPFTTLPMRCHMNTQIPSQPCTLPISWRMNSSPVPRNLLSQKMTRYSHPWPPPRK